MCCGNRTILRQHYIATALFANLWLYIVVSDPYLMAHINHATHALIQLGPMYKLKTACGAPIVVYIAMYYVSRYISCLEYIMEPMGLIRYPVIHHQTCLPLFQPDTVLADFELGLRSEVDHMFCLALQWGDATTTSNLLLNTKSLDQTSENPSSRLGPFPLFRKRTVAMLGTR